MTTTRPVLPGRLLAAATIALTAFLTVPSTAAVPQSSSLELADSWLVQPAANSHTPPDTGLWGRLSGNGNWRSAKMTAVGANWQDADRTSVNSIWYQQQFALPADWQDQRLVADFRRIEGDAIVFLNDERIGELLRPGGEIDLTRAARPGQQNTLASSLPEAIRTYLGPLKKIRSAISPARPAPRPWK